MTGQQFQILNVKLFSCCVSEFVVRSSSCFISLSSLSHPSPSFPHVGKPWLLLRECFPQCTVLLSVYIPLGLLNCLFGYKDTGGSRKKYVLDAFYILGECSHFPLFRRGIIGKSGLSHPRKSQLMCLFRYIRSALNVTTKLSVHANNLRGLYSVIREIRWPNILPHYLCEWALPE